jgi:hypothetical protein
MTRRSAIGLVCAGLVIASAVAFVLVARSDQGRCAPPDWDTWRRGVNEDASPTRRQEIADRVISCHLLDNRSKQYVRARLGNPEGRYRSRRWRFITGAARGIPIDSEELVLEFAHDRVQRVSLRVG